MKKSKSKSLLDKLHKFALKNNISDNVAGPLKDLGNITSDMYSQINRKNNKKKECITYLKQKEDGSYYYCIFGKL